MQATPKKGKVNDSSKKCFCNKKKRYGKITTSITLFYDGKLEKFYKCPKAKLLLLKLIHLFASETLLVKKLEIEEPKIT